MKVIWLFCATCRDRFLLGPGDQFITPPEHTQHQAMGVFCERSMAPEDLNNLFEFWLRMQ